MSTNREQWYADVLRAGLDTGLLAEPDILAHATPAVLIESLPKDVVVRLLDATLATGAMSPEAVVQTATPDILAAHVPPPVIWACFAEAAERAGLGGDGLPDAAGSREFLRRALQQALAHGVAAPRDVVEDVNAAVLGHHFPDTLKTKLLEASLAAGRMNPELILETLGVDAIARYAPTHVVWACLARTGAPAAAAHQPAAPTREPATTAREPAAPAPEAAPAPVASEPVTGPVIASEPAAPAPDPAIAREPPTAREPAVDPLLTPAPLPLLPLPPLPPPESSESPKSPESPESPESPHPAPTGLDLFDDDVASVFVELDDASGMMEVTRDPSGAATIAAPDDKKRTGFARTTKRA
jgi:hypothetical protein